MPVVKKMDREDDGLPVVKKMDREEDGSLNNGSASHVPVRSRWQQPTGAGCQGLPPSLLFRGAGAQAAVGKQVEHRAPHAASAPCWRQR